MLHHFPVQAPEFVLHAIDAAGRQVAVNNPAGDVTETAYRTAGGVTTRHLLDLQPGLTQVLAAIAGANVTRFVHLPGELLSQKDAAANWEWMLPDGLGSVRGVATNAGAVLEHRHFDPYGALYAGAQTETDYGFHTEPVDATVGDR